jgi:uncharacterized damage-inducible protein DinB
MKKYFQQQFLFNEWANKKLVNFIISMNIKDLEILKIMSHIASVEEMWLERLKQTPDYLIDLWETFSIQETEVLLRNSSNNWNKFIKRQNKKSFAEKRCTYENSDGKVFTNLYIEIMQHVLNHSNYHRGQINLLLSKNESNPVEINFMDFLRNSN